MLIASKLLQAEGDTTPLNLTKRGTLTTFNCLLWLFMQTGADPHGALAECEGV